MNRGARETGPALESRRRFLLWLAPAVERFPRSQKFLLDDRVDGTGRAGVPGDLHPGPPRSTRASQRREAAVPVPARVGCRPRIVKPEKCFGFQRLFRSGSRRFKTEIGNFVTKRRSGFDRELWERGKKKDAPDRTAGCCPQPHVNLAAPFVPFGVPRRGRRGAFGASSRKDEGRRSPPSGCTSISSVGRRSTSAPKDENDDPPGRSGFLPVHRSDVENPHCSVKSRSPVRCTARREARRSRRSTKTWACLTGARSALLLIRSGHS